MLTTGSYQPVMLMELLSGEGTHEPLAIAPARAIGENQLLLKTGGRRRVSKHLENV
jgi:hypothetical protein